ncbi:DAR GTPase 3, chloroplastic [Selaginella moellendorffii]|nr:DAR GTPase 3, chloroplastic [Selaginella moellendorffii]|eukprot:XP_002990985.2 DAR GTPase 3, chloroplastic [Selaginella moellendorffii]
MAVVSADLGCSATRDRCGSFWGEKWRSGERMLLRKSLRNYSRISATASLAVRTFKHERPIVDVEMNRLMTTGRYVQWYPGHIAKAERDLKEQLLLVDVVVELRDARIPSATGHPDLEKWIRGKKRILVLNREDMISTADRNAWASYFASKDMPVIFTNGQQGKGIMKLTRQAGSVASTINSKRRDKGLLPRSVRVAVVGFPNIGKSSIINRLLKRKICEAAPRPGVTRQLRWSTIHDGLDLLDSPGILPMKFDDQAAAVKLAICNDIGQESYEVSGVAAVLVERLKRLPAAGAKVLTSRYRVDAEDCSGEYYLELVAQKLFQGDVNQAATRLLLDFRRGKFGWFALESPPSS